MNALSASSLLRAVVAAVLVLAACEPRKGAAGADTPGSDAPSGLTQAVQDAAAKTVKATADAARTNAKPVAQIRLAEALPRAVEGLRCGDVETAESTSPPIATQARRVCQSGDRRVTITLTDHVLNQTALFPLRGIGTHETGDPVSRFVPFHQGEVVGVERVARQGSALRFELLVRERFLLTIDGAGVSRSALAPLITTAALEQLGRVALGD